MVLWPDKIYFGFFKCLTKNLKKTWSRCSALVRTVRSSDFNINVNLVDALLSKNFFNNPLFYCKSTICFLYSKYLELFAGTRNVSL